MFKIIAIAAVVVGSMAPPAAWAHDEEAVRQAPPPAPFVQVSDVLPLPEFLPGLGILFVDPETLPAGPFFGYDRDGKLSATIYMTPIEDLENGASFDDLSVGLQTVTSVDIYYNAGHPGVDAPHAHVVLLHDVDAKGRLSE